MKLVLINLIFLILVWNTSGSIGDLHLCNQNPKFSCNSWSSAIKCNAVTYCLARVWRKDYKKYTAITNYVECGNCHSTVLMFGKKFQTSEPGKILAYILQFCNEAACRRIVSIYFNDIFEMLKNLYFLSNKMCDSLCRANHENIFNEVANYYNNCTLCTRYKNTIIASYTEKQFQEVLEKICIQNKEYSEQCLTIVAKYSGIILNALNKIFHEKNICYSWGFCPSNERSDNFFIASSQKYSEAKINSKPRQNSFKIFVQNSVTDKNEEQNNPLCLYAIQGIQKMIDNDEYKQKFGYAVDKLCGSFNITFYNECSQFFIGLNGIFKEDVTAQFICSFFNYFIANSITYDILNEYNQYFNYTSMFNNPTSTFSDSEGCLTCKDFTKRVLNDLDVKEHIKKIMQQTCKLMQLPNKENICLEYEDVFIRLLDYFADQYLSPDFICLNLDICPLDSEEFELIRSDENTAITIDGLPCTICQQVTSGIINDLVNPKNQLILKRRLLGFCNFLPFLIRMGCKTVIRIQFRKAMMFLRKSTAYMICHFIQLC